MADKPARLASLTICQIRYKKTNSEAVTLFNQAARGLGCRKGGQDSYMDLAVSPNLDEFCSTFTPFPNQALKLRCAEKKVATFSDPPTTQE